MNVRRSVPTGAARRHFLLQGAGLAAAVGIPYSFSGPARSQGDGWAGLRVLDERETRFGRLFVIERGRRRYLAYGPTPRLVYQSAIDLDRPGELTAPYTRLMMLGLVYSRQDARIVQIGVGAGTMTGYVIRNFPAAVVHAVDIDAHAVEFGMRYFGLTPDPRLHLHIEDGRTWLAASTEQFDVVMLDAYDDTTIPPTLAEPGFFAIVAARLAPGGVVMQNAFLPNVDEKQLLAAMHSAFDRVDFYKAGNSAVLAAYDGARRDPRRLLAHAQQIDETLRPVHSLVELLGYRSGTL